MTNKPRRSGRSSGVPSRAFLTLALVTLTACAAPSAAEGPHSAELRTLFEEDQAIRLGGFDGFSSEQIRAVMAEDAVRKARILELVGQDALRLPEDCYRAAMVLQHGNEPKDYLLAHVLAAAAAQDGHQDARWLSAASLDRYLMAIDQPQVFRTQFNSEGGGPWTQDPALDTLGDALREQFGVPSLAESKENLAKMNRP